MPSVYLEFIKSAYGESNFNIADIECAAKRIYGTLYYQSFPCLYNYITMCLNGYEKNNTTINTTYIDAKNETELLRSFNNKYIEILKIKNLNHYLKSGTENIEHLYEIEDEASAKIIKWINK